FLYLLRFLFSFFLLYSSIIDLYLLLPTRRSSDLQSKFSSDFAISSSISTITFPVPSNNRFALLFTFRLGWFLSGRNLPSVNSLGSDATRSFLNKLFGDITTKGRASSLSRIFA